MNTLINPDLCRIHKASRRLSKSLRGVSSDPNTIRVIQMGVDAKQAYQEALQYLKNESLGIISPQVVYSSIPTQELVIKHATTYYCIALEAQAMLFTGDTETLRQLVYDPTPYRQKGYNPFYSMAWQYPQGQVQYSQIIIPTDWTQPLHEWFHNWYFYLGLSDRTHEIIEQEARIVQKAYPKIITELVAAWPIKDTSPFPYVSTF